MSTDLTFSPEQLHAVESILGYSFKDKKLLEQCFTLASASRVNNERLEFLGDSVMQFVVSDILYRRLKGDEGDMTELRKAFVSNEVLWSVVEEMDLKRYIRYSGKQQNLGKKPVASLFEAIIAGIFLDGGLRAAKKFIVEKLVKVRSEKLFKTKLAQEKNFKGVLQEYLQGKGQPRAVYQLIQKSGPDHNPTFLVSVKTQSHQATGTGNSKTAAEQAAAKKLLESIRQGKTE